MDAKGIKQLIDKLNGHTATALESAAGFASSRSHFEVLPEHLLIKLMEEGSNGDLEHIFHFFNVNQDAVWHELLDFLNRQPAGNQSKPTFSRRLYEWLERAWLSANVQHKSDFITGAALVDSLTELLPYSPVLQLPALLDKIDSRFLAENLDKICQQSSERLNPAAKSQSANKSEGSNDSAALDEYCEDLTAKAEQGKIDPVLGRNDEIRMMVDVLCRRRKNNPILVGDPGVGKTAVVEGFAQRIVDGQVPQDLQGVRLLVLDMGLLQAGAGVKGEFERRLKAVIDEVKNSTTPIIMFIDEAHTLIGAGGDAGMSDAANLLKPALARGELRTVAATTWSEYKKYFERDAALERRFQLIKVDEPTEQAAQLMLAGLKDKYQQHHNIQITDDAIEAAVVLSSRYITGRYLPDKAIDVLDTAAARVRMSFATDPAAIEAEREHINYLETRINSLNIELGQGLAVDQDKLTHLVEELVNAQSKLAELTHSRESQISTLSQINEIKQASDKDLDSESLLMLRQSLKEQNTQDNGLFSEVDADAVAQIISQWTGVPVGAMVKDQISNLINLEATIGQEVIGQQAGIAKIAQTLRVSKAGVSNDEGPLGVFLLAGPSGVGKTETARCLAKQLFGGDKFLTTINMSEYQESHTVSQLKGSPPGYVGYGEGGVLTEAVRQRPYSVILLDEVEKAHKDVMNMFYQVFERGSMRDGEGREIDFKNTVIIMTSNLGSAELIDACTPPTVIDLSPKEDDEESQQTEHEAAINEALNPAQAPINEDGTPWSVPTIGALTDLIKPQLLAFFAPALLARMQVIPYLALDSDALQSIVSLKLEAIANRLHENHKMQLRVDASVLEKLTTQCTLSDSGARMVNAVIEQQILPGIAKSILEFMAEEDMPDILTLAVDEHDEITATFADNA